jgi:hypothetical protein
MSGSEEVPRADGHDADRKQADPSHARRTANGPTAGSATWKRLDVVAQPPAAVAERRHP